MIIHLKPGAKKTRPFSTLRTSYGVYFVEPVVSQQGRYIMASIMQFQEIGWQQAGVSTMEMQKRIKSLLICIYTINNEYLWFSHGYP